MMRNKLKYDIIILLNILNIFNYFILELDTLQKKNKLVLLRTNWPIY